MDNSIMHLNEIMKDGLHYLVDIVEIDGEIYSKFAVYDLSSTSELQGFSVTKYGSDHISIEMDQYQQCKQKNFFQLKHTSLFYPAFKNLIQNNTYKIESLKNNGKAVISEKDKAIQISFDNFNKNESYLINLCPNEKDLLAKKSYAILENLVLDMTALTSNELMKPYRREHHKKSSTSM